LIVRDLCDGHTDKIGSLGILVGFCGVTHWSLAYWGHLVDLAFPPFHIQFPLMGFCVAGYIK